MLKVNDIVFKYTGQTEDYRFNLTAAPATVTAITGRSGSGKSTLLELIAGFLTPRSGTIEFDGDAITWLSPEDRPVTMLFQKHNLFEHRTALDNVVVGINTSIPKRGTDVDECKAALARVGLGDFLQTRASKLSGGQQQRVAIARALVRRRGLILLDEPYSALDSDTRNEMLALTRALADDDQRTVLMVTHDLRDCEAIADVHYDLSSGSLQSAVE